MGVGKGAWWCPDCKKMYFNGEEPCDHLESARIYNSNHYKGEVHYIGEAPVTKALLPTVAEERKRVPIFSGVLRYFPKALAAVAGCSFQGNEQHNPGTPLHWDRSKSGDELDALVRHLMEAGSIDTDGIRHSTKVAWRALANLEKELEADA